MKSYSVNYTHPDRFHATRDDVMAVDASDAANIVETKFPGAEVVSVVLESLSNMPKMHETPLCGEV